MAPSEKYQINQFASGTLEILVDIFTLKQFFTQCGIYDSSPIGLFVVVT